MSKSEPILNVPPSVTAASALMVAIQLVRGFLPDETDLTFLLALAFIPARYSGAAPELPGGYVTAITSFVTYMVVHAGWVHLIVNLLWMLAFGSAVARRIGDLKFICFSLLCGIAGAFTHLAFHYGDMAPVVGASAAISGQMAGALRFIFRAPGHPEQRPAHHRVPCFLGRGERLFRHQRSEDCRPRGRDCVGSAYWRVPLRALPVRPVRQPPRHSAGNSARPLGVEFGLSFPISCALSRSGTECRSQRD